MRGVWLGGHHGVAPPQVTSPLRATSSWIHSARASTTAAPAAYLPAGILADHVFQRVIDALTGVPVGHKEAAAYPSEGGGSTSRKSPAEGPLSRALWRGRVDDEGAERVSGIPGMAAVCTRTTRALCRGCMHTRSAEWRWKPGPCDPRRCRMLGRPAIPVRGGSGWWAGDARDGPRVRTHVLRTLQGPGWRTDGGCRAAVVGHACGDVCPRGV